MNYDLYAALDGKSSKQDIDALVGGRLDGMAMDIATRIRLLAGIAAQNEEIKDYVVSGDRMQGGGYKSLVHRKNPQETPYAALIKEEHARLDALGLLNPAIPKMTGLPLDSWFLQFQFTLATPYISKDDESFYVSEGVNPVRKDKVFKVPMIAASSWKGLVRWAAMHVRLKENALAEKDFAQERLFQTLLFGDENGMGEEDEDSFAHYLDYLNKLAVLPYQNLLREYFGVASDKSLPHHRGRLFFYPTFFDLIDIEVINPHSRKTKAGTHPIYLESVPATAKGTFSLLYVPFNEREKTHDKIQEQSRKGLVTATDAVTALMRVYGFSAKRTSGFGEAQDDITGSITIGTDQKTFRDWSQLSEMADHVRF